MILMSPPFLWALPAAALPIIIYLLFRRKRRNTAWGAIFILKKVMETRARHMLWIQYLIIALRAIAIAAAALLFARPYAPWHPPRDGAFPAPPPATHRVVLLDTSAGMQSRFGAGSRMDAALSVCRGIVHAGRFPVRVDLLPMTGSTNSFRSDRFPVRAERVEELLAGCAAESGRIAAESALRKAAELFRSSPFQGKELYILSGFGLRDFSEPSVLSPFFRELGRQGVSVFALRFHEAGARNFGVFDLSPGGDVLLALQPTSFRLTVGYYGDDETAETRVSVTDSKGRLLREEPLALANGERTVTFALALPSGENTLVVRLPGDDLAADNVISRSFSVKNRLVVLAAQDIAVMKRGFENPRAWLGLALDNQAKGEVAHGAPGADDELSNESPFSVELVGQIPEQINAESLDGAALLILLDVASMPAEALDAVNSYVARGGTVILAPGPDADHERFNQSFAGLAPMLIDAPGSGPIDPERYEHCYVETGDDPFWIDLESAGGANLGSPRFYNHYRTMPDSLAEGARVLLSLTDNSPLLAERRIGRGYVLLWTAGFGSDWHSMSVHAGFPVMLISLANQALCRSAFPRNLAPGAPIISAVDADRAKVIRPDGGAETVSAVRAGGRSFVRFDKTELPGDYEVRTDAAGDLPGRLYHVRGDPGDSDVRTMGPAMRSAFETACGVELFDQESDLVKHLGGRYQGRPWSPLIAAALMIGLLLEMWLSRRFFT